MKQATVYNEEQLEVILRDTLLLPHAPLSVQEWLAGPSYETRIALWNNKYSTKGWSNSFLSSTVVYGVYCTNCFAKLGECVGGGLKISCAFCTRFSRPACIASKILENLIVGTYGEAVACKVLDEYHLYWSRANVSQHSDEEAD